MNPRTVNEKLLDKIIRHSVYIERFKAGETKRMLPLLRRVLSSLSDKLIADLARVSPDKWSIKHLKVIKGALDRMMTTGMVYIRSDVVDHLMDLAELEAKWSAGIIEKTVPVGISLNLPSVEVIRKLVLTKPMEGHKLDTWLKSYSISVRDRMMGKIKQGIVAGESIPDIVKRFDIAERTARKQMEYITRTAISSVVHTAREEVFKNNKDIVKKVLWVSTLDDRTTEQCMVLDGQWWRTDEDHPTPPIHFNCRSTIVPIIASWEEMGIEAPPEGTRAGKALDGMDGSVPETMTYKEWLMEKRETASGKEEIKDILGERKGQAFIDNPDVFEKFVNKDYEPLSMKELEDREIIKPKQSA